MESEFEPMPAASGKATRQRGRPKGSRNAITRDIRETIKAAFYKAGGRDYLVRLAVTRPEVFVALLGRIVPTEARVSLTTSYEPVRVQVEDRDSPALIGAPCGLGRRTRSDWVSKGPRRLPRASKLLSSQSHYPVMPSARDGRMPGSEPIPKPL